MRARLNFALAVLLLAGGTLSAEDKKADPIDPKKLIGRWERKDDKGPGTQVIEFTADGKMVSIVTLGGKEERAVGTYKLDGDKLTMTLKLGDEQWTATQTISKLTDTELVSAEAGGKANTLVHIKDK
jgi:uncharacterized protein (TIGR03066 family)